MATHRYEYGAFAIPTRGYWTIKGDLKIEEESNNGDDVIMVLYDWDADSRLFDTRQYEHASTTSSIKARFRYTDNFEPGETFSLEVYDEREPN